MKKNTKNKNDEDKFIEKRWRNKKGQWLSTRDVENIRQFYLKNVPAENQPESLREEVRTFDKETLKKVSQLGAGMFIEGSQIYLADGIIDSFVDITTNERINLGKRDKSTFLIGNERVTARELQQALQKYSDEEKAKAIKKGHNWYKTMVYLEYSREDNILLWDLKRDSSFIASGLPNEKKKKK